MEVTLNGYCLKEEEEKGKEEEVGKEGGEEEGEEEGKGEGKEEGEERKGRRKRRMKRRRGWRRGRRRRVNCSLEQILCTTMARRCGLLVMPLLITSCILQHAEIILVLRPSSTRTCSAKWVWSMVIRQRTKPLYCVGAFDITYAL